MWVLLLGVLGGVALAAADGAAVAGAASTTIAELHGQTPVRAWNGVQAWTDYSAADQRWHVVVRRNGQISTPPAIPAGDLRLKVDVGPGPDGAPALAFVSCADRCRAVVSDLDGGRARTIPGSESASSATIWGSRVAWVRGRATVLTRRSGAAKATRLAGVPRRRCYESIGRRYCERPSAGSVSELELRGERLALIDTYLLAHGGGANGTTEVRMEPVAGGAQRLVASMNVGEGAQSWNGPSWARGGLFFYMSCPFACPRQEGPYRYDPVGGAYAKASTAGAIAGFAMDDAGSRAFEALSGASAIGDRSDSAGYTTSLQLTGPLTFARTRAPIASLGG
jgi:hypothetical protein